MNIEIITSTLELDVYGFSGVAVNGDYTGMTFKLMDSMWKIVKENKLENKGQNIWIYGQNNSLFAGVELNNIPDTGMGLEHKRVSLSRYAYYKHTGPYHLIKQVGRAMNSEIKNRGFEVDTVY